MTREKTPQPTTWWWVRHGPTHAKGLVGWSDLAADLSDQGAIARLKTVLPEQALLVSSDLRRASKTADAIGGTRHRLPHARELREINFGAWEEKTFADVTKTDPDLSRAFWTTPGEIAPPGGESWNQTAARVGRFVDRLNHQHAGADIVAVAHFAVILTQLQRAGKMAATSALSFKIDNLSVTRLQYLDPDWRVLGVNTRA